ncbi:hypothetical protein [Dickeya oryzae]
MQILRHAAVTTQVYYGQYGQFSEGIDNEKRFSELLVNVAL